MSPTPTPTVGRRRFLQTATLLAVGGAAASSVGSAAAQEEVDLTDWFANVSNADGVVDERGTPRVTVQVGAEGNGGGFAFEPAAVRVDPGTTVVWEWTGEGGAHNVADEDGAFESDLVGEAGHTFSHAFDAAGVSLYACTPHKAMGMKGAVIVGDVPVTVTAAPPAPERTYVEREPDYGDWFDDVSNFEGTVDARGEDEVVITVGAEGNGGAFAFDPPAVHVDPGTRVVWEWAGEGGSHDVSAVDDGYASAVQSTGRFGQVFDGVGISRYVCTPHEATGMKGAVVVGDVFEGILELSTEELLVLGGFGTAILSPTLFGAFLWLRDRGGKDHDATVPDPDVHADGGTTPRRP
ncbi:halocyanin domain-containing protein [Halorarius litoreus]|uniref:halocyanin domain-containing protein n=1 Tax=Halorarius litoreus TaxID=2962676 RepID=UPI0020CBA8A9|nr:halocyanin domain-containing protein [Halorarius litoreus]